MNLLNARTMIPMGKKAKYLLQRSDNQVQAPDGGWWIDPTTGSLYVRCPECKCAGGLDDHEVDQFGVVTPSLVCPNRQCSFHEWVELLEY